MNITSHYKLNHFIPWTRRKIYLMFFLSTLPTALFYFLGWTWLAIPWVPVAMLGTATAFISGFRNTQTYNRSKEAGSIYEAIQTDSRNFGRMINNFIRNEDTQKQKAFQREIIYRHFAWLTTLRYQLRESKPWEYIQKRAYNREYLKHYKVPEWEGSLEKELLTYLGSEETQLVLKAANPAVCVLNLQSERLRKLNEDGVIGNGGYQAMEGLLNDLTKQQSHCESIKNTPYPRQFTSINLYFTLLLCIFIPLGFIGAFAPLIKDHGPLIIWLTVPISIVIGWVFLVLEQIGESTENPFEGGANDVPITTISREIERDMREVISDSETMLEIDTAWNHILM